MRDPQLRLLACITLVLVFSACSQNAGKAERGAVASGVVTISTVPSDELRMRAEAALAERRFFAPAGSAAADLLLELRERGRATPADIAALTELQPYLVIAIEQAIEQRRRDEASRLVDLLRKVDKAAPALPRLSAGVQSLETLATAPAEAADAATAASAPKSSGTFPVLPPQVGAAIPPSAPVPVAAVRSVETPPATNVAVAPGEDEPSVPAKSASEPPRAREASTADLRIVQDAKPRYPARALSRRLSGQVEVGFTVRPDGSIGDVRVVSSQPEGVFDETALLAAQRWRFAPVSSSVTTSRVLSFSPPPG